MELWDAYDQSENKLGFTLVRGESIPEGAFHLVCNILVRHENGKFLLMRRDLRKEGYPGMYELSAGGSALCGETPEVCAHRELLEETGIDCPRITELAKRSNSETLYHDYYAITDCDPDSIRLQEGETIGYLWADKAQVYALLADGKLLSTGTEEVFRNYIEKLSKIEE